MGTALLVSIEQYMATSYRPDCDYVDGEVLERNVGKYDHSNLQTVLPIFLGPKRREWKIRILVEQRLRITARRVRIPDVMIISSDLPIEQVITQPPMVCMEILSEDDSLRSTQPRLDDYEEMGVQNIWVFDPKKRLAWTYASGQYHPAGAYLSVPDSDVAIHLQDLYDDLQ